MNLALSSLAFGNSVSPLGLSDGAMGSSEKKFISSPAADLNPAPHFMMIISQFIPDLLAIPYSRCGNLASISVLLGNLSASQQYEWDWNTISQPNSR